MADKVEFMSNGIRCTVAMFLTSSDEEIRESLTAIAMSLPLGAALAITSMHCDGPTVDVELVPHLFDPGNEEAAIAIERIKEIVETAIQACLTPTHQVNFSPTSFGTMKALDDSEEQDEKLILPSHRILVPSDNNGMLS